jgi:hypothetical protein
MESRKMIKNKLLATLTGLSLSLFFPSAANSQNWTTFEHQNNRYYYNTLSSQNVAYYRYEVPAMTIGVFTIKNKSGRADFDVYVFEDPQGNKLIAKGENSGSDTELVITPLAETTKYVYVVIVNAGSSSAKYHFFANYVSPINRFMKVALTTPLSCDNNGSDEWRSRSVAAITSLLEGNDIGGLTQDVVINEITDKIRKEFGYGCFGDFLVNYAIDMVQGVLRNYP